MKLIPVFELCAVRLGGGKGRAMSSKLKNDSRDKRPARVSGAGLTGAQAVAEVIARQKDPVVFGMPGGYTMHIYDALIRHGDAVTTHLVRQESIATVAAEVRGRMTGEVSFVIGQGAWVLGNAGIGIMEAHLGASPMVLLIDATDGGTFSHLGPYQAGLGGYGAYDLPAAMTAITKRTFVANDPTQALQMTQQAVKHALTGERGPVAVIFHGRSLFERVDPSKQPPSYLERSYAGPSAVLAPTQQLVGAEQLLRATSKAVLVVGNGIRLANAEAVLLAFAESTGIPVATTPAGKGTFPENHSLALGVIGAFGHETANHVVGDSDVVFAVGTKLGATDTANQDSSLIDASRQTLIQLDIEPLNLSWTYPADQLIHGDASDALERLKIQMVDWSIDGMGTVAAARERHGFFKNETAPSAAEMSGRDVIRVLSQESDDAVVVTCDAGENRLFVLRDFQSKRGGTVLQPNGGGGMGYAIPAGLSVALAFPGRAVVAVCGDGGLSMSVHSLMSAVELGVSMTVIVLDNGILGWVYNGQRGRVIASELAPFDYAGIATALGCHSTGVSTLQEFRVAFEEAKSSPGVKIIVAKTSKDDTYQDLMASLNAHDVYAVPELAQD
jgi:acetolactate synthase-1/2/3 large subunit